MTHTNGDDDFFCPSLIPFFDIDLQENQLGAISLDEFAVSAFDPCSPRMLARPFDFLDSSKFPFSSPHLFVNKEHQFPLPQVVSRLPPLLPIVEEGEVITTPSSPERVDVRLRASPLAPEAVGVFFLQTIDDERR